MVKLTDFSDGIIEMRIQETKVSATCAKMTEEKSSNGDLSGVKKREFGIDNTNGSLSPNLISSSDSECTNSVGGGRLKFFKDGKFILELSHRKEGERTCWIPVNWPTVGTPRQESSTSLSVSDDNSSVQSSPWQRDHCLKQNAPVQNAARGMEFAMIRPSCLRRLSYTSKGVKCKKRRPFDTSKVCWNERYVSQGNRTLSSRPHLGLAAVIQNLWERVIRADPGIVSPRKRILRDLERVTLEDHPANSKRQRPRPNAEQLLPKPVSSHSITSILSREDEPSFLRTLLRSPPSEPLPPSFISPSSLHSLYHHPSSSFRPLPPPPSSYFSPLPGYRGSPSVWNFHYPLSSLPRGSVYPGGLVNPYPPLASQWNPITHPSLEDLKRDDGSSDVPLNLSKHAG
uniref:Uncharacterized protein n=2 Tax=Clastoptera arizonana TaxID=38151 RepID=A0A1B6D9X0_9HEMI